MTLLNVILAAGGLGLWLGAFGWYFRRELMSYWHNRGIGGFRD